MCAIFGFLNHGNKVSNAVLKRLIKALSICAEVRGTDATGISYVKDGKIVTFKKAKPAHKVKLYFPTGIKTVIGHTRFSTQGDEKFNYNNHPFESEKGFALAHNGVLYNDKELHEKYMLSDTKIETDSYVAVQLLEHFGGADMESIKCMSEVVEGSFTFTILRNDNTLFLVKGTNPITIYHFAELGIYVYASTKEILDNALKVVGFNHKHKEIKMTDGEILQINSDGTAVKDTFEIAEKFVPRYWNYSCCDDWYNDFESEEKDLLFDYCGMFGVSENDVELLLEYGYTADEIEDLLMNTTALEEVLNEIKGIERW
ncbi:MAG: glucosamine 6-phosphate synthetase [Ruminococcus flavefaciens]|nr:glucosamine 6-phosphate synthetase [Ruminococcus flavefaciens]